MRILLVSDFFPPVRGGLEGHVDNLSGALAGLGHDVHVATLTERPRPTSSLVTAHTIRAASSRLLPHVDGDRPFHPPAPDPLARRGLAKLLRELRPDVIHGHSWLSVSLPARTAPLVLTAHDYGYVCHKRTFTRPDGAICSGPSRACFSCGREQYGTTKGAALALATPLGRRLLRPDAVIAVSTPVRDALQGSGMTGVVVIPNFVPDVASTGLPAALPVDGRFVMFAGDPSTHKGIDVLLDAWQKLRRDDVSLLLATTRPIGRELPLDVHTVTLAKSHMHDAWSRADLAVVPSVWPDPFPTVVLEAMAAGTPVVASAVGGIPDMIDTSSGVLVPPGDSTALAHKLASLLDDEAWRASLGDAGRRRVGLFTASEVVPRIVDVYGRTVAEAAA